MKKEQMEPVKEKVIEYFNNYGSQYIYGYFGLSRDDVDHIIRTGTEIMMNHWELTNWKPGGFITNFLENNLMETYASADMVNQKVIPFYLRMKYNLEYPVFDETISSNEVQ